MKKVFISYSRKNDKEVFEFRSNEKFREFEILIDDEDVKFDTPWKESILQKINEANGAILFISNDALKPDSPIRTLELPKIAKRIRDEKDSFSFFPIFLEEIDKEKLEKYSFTIAGSDEEVNFLEFFQVLNIENQNKIKDASKRKRDNFFKDINGNISSALKGEGIFSSVLELSKLRRRKRAQNITVGIALFASLFLFSRTDAFAKVLIVAYQQVVGDTTEENDNATVRFLAGQLNNIDNLEELGVDEGLLESIQEIDELNSNINQSLDQVVEDFNSSLAEEAPTTTTTVAPTTTTTVAPTTTTTVAPTTTTTVAPTTTLPDSDTQGPTLDSYTIQEAYTSGGNYFWGSYDNEISLTGGDATIRMSLSTSDDYSNVDLNNSTIFIVDSSGNNVTTNPTSAILDSCRSGLWCSITIPSNTTTGNYLIRANLIDTAPSPNTRVVDVSNFNIIKPIDTQAPTLTSLTMYEWDGNTWNSFDSYLNTTGGDGSIKAIITADDDLSNLDLNASTAFIEYPDGTLGQSNVLDYCRTGANGCAFTIPRSAGEGEFKLKATFVDTASPANSKTEELYSFTVTCLGCTTTTTTTTTVPVENPHLENSLIWWVNDTDICFYTEVDASSGTIKWKVYINDVLQFENQGPAGQSTHFTNLKTSAGSSGDSLTLRVEVYDGNGTLYENTTFATTTLGSGSSYYQNITDVGNECPIGKTP
jgi:hypothetical protein